MDGENNGKPQLKMDDLGGKPHYFRKHPYVSIYGRKYMGLFHAGHHL